MTDDDIIDGAAVLNDVEAHFGRFIATTDDRDLSLVALWTVATHVAVETYTSPRLLIDSTTPGSGKTTLLDHIGRLACSPLHAASLSSPAVLVRALQGGIRTLLVDEVDRSLSPNKPGVEDMVAILNSGYRRGATRPVLVPVKGGGWEVKEMPTFSPVALAGNSPRLPDDTRSRAIRILLMPDRTGRVEDSDWELIEGETAELKARIVAWTDQVRDQILGMPVDLPHGCIGRAKEKWRPLKRVAVAAGSHWPAIVDELITRGMAETDAEHDAGLSNDPPGMVMLRDLHAVWPSREDFVPTEQLVSKLVMHNPEYWGLVSAYGKALTARRLGHLVSQASKVTSQRPGGVGPRGYTRAVLAPIWERLGIGHSQEPGGSGGTGGSGGNRRSNGVTPSRHTTTGLPRVTTTSGGGSHEPQTPADLHKPPDQPLSPVQPVVSDTPIATPLHVVPDRPSKVSSVAWFHAHIEGLIAAGATTAESSKVYAAGQRAGYNVDALRQAARNSDLVSMAIRRADTMIWNLGVGTTPTVVSCEEWALDWLAARNEWVRAGEVYAAGEKAGYGRTAIKGVGQDCPHILKRGASVSTEWRISPDYRKASA
ncbi:DUF3631 domain-containing protein [Williamsia sterculiae]|uniref:DUF3631 domain-containing protein n=1 Tax=Williamsia sterculiae TaxID=1344003 RepID=A0A1N7HBH1_9NOCA|nr:DUF3631 domain-containing protein [Williamsia sterculiae]SIS22216.1 Protein of unknown function [Williamsia sterculiae]